MSSETVMGLTMEDHQKAFTEVAFLIDIFTSTIDNIMGGATASVGRIALFFSTIPRSRRRWR
jgi:hypothetical protein